MSTATIPAEFAIGVREMFLDQLKKEVQTTKRVLEAVPDAKSDYRPDPNSRSAADLAKHIASSDVVFLHGIAQGSFNDMMDPEKTKQFEAGMPKSSKELATWYEKEANAAIEKVKTMPAAQLTQIIDFFGAFQLPAFAYLFFLNNHSVHHRAQLSTYLRPMGSKCPDIYGGSYDEPWKG